MRSEVDSARFLFTYGTLMSSSNTDLGRVERALLAASGRFVGRARVRGRLYDAGACPAALAIPSARGFVHGEVWMLPARVGRLMHALDRYEGCDASTPPPHPYRRTAAVVLHELGWELAAWVYVWNGPVAALKPIRSGIWRPSLVALDAAADAEGRPLTAAHVLSRRAA